MVSAYDVGSVIQQMCESVIKFWLIMHRLSYKRLSNNLSQLAYSMLYT